MGAWMGEQEDASMGMASGGGMGPAVSPMPGRRGPPLISNDNFQQREFDRLALLALRTPAQPAVHRIEPIGYGGENPGGSSLPAAPIRRSEASIPPAYDVARVVAVEAVRLRIREAGIEAEDEAIALLMFAALEMLDD